MTRTAAEDWDSGHAYEQYVGRWLALSPGLAWADVGCGTGALASTILTMCEPSSVHGIDSSEGFVAQARERVKDPRARFDTGDATRLPWESARVDVAVSGLVLWADRDDRAGVGDSRRRVNACGC